MPLLHGPQVRSGALGRLRRERLSPSHQMPSAPYDTCTALPLPQAAKKQRSHIRGTNRAPYAHKHCKAAIPTEAERDVTYRTSSSCTDGSTKATGFSTPTNLARLLHRPKPRDTSRIGRQALARTEAPTQPGMPRPWTLRGCYTDRG